MNPSDPFLVGQIRRNPSVAIYNYATASKKSKRPCQYQVRPDDASHSFQSLEKVQGQPRRKRSELRRDRRLVTICDSVVVTRNSSRRCRRYPRFEASGRYEASRSRPIPIDVGYDLAIAYPEHVRHMIRDVSVYTTGRELWDGENDKLTDYTTTRDRLIGSTRPASGTPRNHILARSRTTTTTCPSSNLPLAISPSSRKPWLRYEEFYQLRKKNSSDFERSRWGSRVSLSRWMETLCRPGMTKPELEGGTAAITLVREQRPSLCSSLPRLCRWACPRPLYIIPRQMPGLWKWCEMAHEIWGGVGLGQGPYHL